jgi:hypothetical protein
MIGRAEPEPRHDNGAMSHHLAPLADILPHSIGPYLSLMVAGFLVGIFGHLSRSRWLVAIGVFMIFLATVIFPLALIATEDNPPAPEDPRLEEVP